MAKILPLYGKAAVLTVRIGVLGIIFAMLVGLVCSVVRQMKIPVLKQLASVYIELSRNTPLLVQLFFIYYGLPKIGIKTDPETCGVAGLAFLGGSYMAEAFRSGLEAVDRSQTEAGQCIGLTAAQNIRFVILPQALATAVPALFANIIFLIKETSMFSVLAMMDLMNVADTLRTSGGRTIEVLFMLVAAYLVLLLPVSLIATLVERRLRYAGFGDRHPV